MPPTTGWGAGGMRPQNVFTGEWGDASPLGTRSGTCGLVEYTNADPTNITSNLGMCADGFGHPRFD